MEQSGIIPNDSDSYHKLSKEQRMVEAKRIYQLLRNSPQKSLPKEQDKAKDSGSLEDKRVGEQLQSIEGKEHLCSKICLLVLEGLQNGVKLRVLRKENPVLNALSEIKLKNTPIVSLKRLSKLFIELLPKNIINLSQKEFYEKYLFNGRMLAFYKKHDLSLLATFRNLFGINDWQRENKEYLNRGFSRDYIPNEIMEKLTELTQTFKQMNWIYDSFENQIKRQKRNRTPKTQSPLPIIYPATNQSVKDKISIQELLQAESNIKVQDYQQFT